MADKRVYSCVTLTGGASGALDALPYNSLQDGELAFTVTDDYIYVHIFDASSSASESPPDVIAPDDVGSNTGRWLLRLNFLEPLYVDRTNNRVSVGVSSPSVPFQVEGPSGDYRTGFGIDTDDNTYGPTIYGYTTRDENYRIYFKGSFIASDDQAIRFADSSRYWMKYDSASGKWSFSSTDIDGLGTNGVVFEIYDGTDDVIFNGSVSIGTVTPDRILHAELSDATVSAVSYPFRLTHVTTGTPATGIGVGMEFEVETADGNNEVGATIEAVTTDVTGGSEDFDLVFKLMAGGSAVAEKARLTSDGKLGVGVSPEEAVHASGKGYFTEGVRVREDVDDYGGNFTNYTPPTGASALIILAADTNATNPGQRLYAYVNGSWRYVDLT